MELLFASLLLLTETEQCCVPQNSLYCPQYVTEFVDSNGQCVYVCVDGRAICPCITGPFDGIQGPEILEVDYGCGQNDSV